MEFDVENGPALRSGLQCCGLQTGLVYGVETFASIADPRLPNFGPSVLSHARVIATPKLGQTVAQVAILPYSFPPAVQTTKP